MQKHLIISDLHVPDHNIQALKLLHKFIGDFKPDTFHILGDFMCFTHISKYLVDARYHVSLADEVDAGYAILRTLVESLRKANKKVEITWHMGNHDQKRLLNYISKNAPQLADLKKDGEYVLSMENLFDLKKLGVKTVSDTDDYLIGDCVITHGDIIRAKGGYTAHAMIDKYGTSGLSGHTHRLSYISKTQFRSTKFWIETGCLCNLKQIETPVYSKMSDWQQGFAVLLENKGKTYPQIVPIVGNSFSYGGKVYEN